MSIATMVALASAMEKISSFIPSEVIGIYVAGFGIFSPESSAGKWWIFGICALLVPVFIALNYIPQRSHSDDLPSVRIALILLFFGLVVFIAWAAALPGMPFLFSHADRYGYRRLGCSHPSRNYAQSRRHPWRRTQEVLRLLAPADDA